MTALPGTVNVKLKEPLLVLFGTLSPTFFSLPTFTTIANEIPDLLVMAVGMTFILMIGGIDLSVGSVLALAASVLSIAMTKLGWGVLPAALAGVLVATAAGAVTGNGGLGSLAITPFELLIRLILEVT